MHTHDRIAATIKAAVVSATLALLTVSVSAQAAEIDSKARRTFEIGPESLEAALAAFSTQSGLHVVSAGIPAAALSPGVKGNLSQQNALIALLRGTGVSFRQVTADTVVVVPAQMARLRPTQLQLAGDASSDALADQASAAAAPAAAAPSQLSEVQVTGTRIVREGYEAPTPVTAVGIQQLQDVAANNIGDTLNQLPVFQGSLTNNTETFHDNEGSQTELNLRNLNANRTLILFDGRRLPTANTENVPDIDLIPDGLVQRVDVVTGGASAVYGSDAVAGVVNYILDTNFTGVKGVVQGGISGFGDAESDKIQLTLGSAFLDGRLHLLLSGDQRYQTVVEGTARSWNMVGQATINNPAFITNPHAPQTIAEPCCVAIPGYNPGGIILNGPLQGSEFGVAGAVSQYNYGVGLTTAGNRDYGGSWQDAAVEGQEDIVPADSSYHEFARAGFDITPSVQAYLEYMHGWDHTVFRYGYDYYPTGIGTLYTNNPYLPASVASQAAADGVSSFSFGDTTRYPPGVGGSSSQYGGLGANEQRYADVVAFGLRGSFNIGKNAYNWNLFAQQGSTIEDFQIYEGVKTNLSDAIEAVRVGSYGGTTAYTDPATLGGATHSAAYNAANFPNPLALTGGTITCASNLLPRANPAATSNCAPYNVFGIGQASDAAIIYKDAFARLRQDGLQTVLGGDVTGEPFSTWAGPVSLALDVEYRHEVASGFGDGISSATGFFSTNFFPFEGHQYVTEGALETVIPILKGLPGVQELDLNGGARATDYSTSGYVTTYKYGLEYTPINDLRVRATESYDIRAPNLSDLFGYSNGHGGAGNDPFFGNISAPGYTITLGNPNLRPEKAHQYEVGIVFQPTEVPGLNLSVDFYHINITGAIGTLGTTYELQQCYNSRIPGTYTGTSPFCSLIARNPDNSLYSTTVIPFNIASYLAQGVDYQADYRKQLAELVASWPGALDFHLTATNTQHLITNTGIAGPAQILDAAGSGNVPRWAILGTLTYDLDRWHFAWTERYDSSTLFADNDIVCSTNCPSPVPAGFATVGFVPRAPTYFLANLSIAYRLMEHDQQNAEAFADINNVFNKIPPWDGGGGGYGPDTNLALFDMLGTYVRAGLRFRL